jgi:hypothetical protein
MQHPQVFYKYASAGTGLIVLEGGKLRWSSPLLFNDVSEFQRMPRFEPTVAEAFGLLPAALLGAIFDGEELDQDRLSGAIRLLLAMLRDAVADGASREHLMGMLSSKQPDADERVVTALRSLFEAKDLDRARVLCLTTNPCNDAMWGNYADSHAGLVLGFRHIEHRSTPLLEAKKVSYSEERPVVGSGLDLLLYGDTNELRSRTLHAVCFTKKSVWSYESEWRVLTWRPNEVNKRHGDYQFWPDELESVTLGQRAGQDTETKVRQLMERQYPKAALHRISLVDGELVRQPARPPVG